MLCPYTRVQPSYTAGKNSRVGGITVPPHTHFVLALCRTGGLERALPTGLRVYSIIALIHGEAWRTHATSSRISYYYFFAWGADDSNIRDVSGVSCPALEGTCGHPVKVPGSIVVNINQALWRLCHKGFKRDHSLGAQSKTTSSYSKYLNLIHPIISSPRFPFSQRLQSLLRHSDSINGTPFFLLHKALVKHNRIDPFFAVPIRTTKSSCTGDDAYACEAQGIPRPVVYRERKK